MQKVISTLIGSLADNNSIAKANRWMILAIDFHKLAVVTNNTVLLIAAETFIVVANNSLYQSNILNKTNIKTR